eukprot:1587511-Rhodomonas_salina.1
MRRRVVYGIMTYLHHAEGDGRHIRGRPACRVGHVRVVERRNRWGVVDRNRIVEGDVQVA